MLCKIMQNVMQKVVLFSFPISALYLIIIVQWSAGRISIPTFSRGKVIFSQGMKIPQVQISDLTIQFRSDLRYVPMLGTFLSYERSLIRTFSNPGLRGDLPIKKVKIFQGIRQDFPGNSTRFSREID